MTPWVPVHSLAERDYLQFRRRAIFECDKWDPQVGDVSVVARHPLVLRSAAWEEVRHLAEALAAETMAAEVEIASRPVLHDRLGLPRAVRRALARAPVIGPSAGTARIIRFDFHHTTDGWRISEANTDVPGGLNEASGFARLMAPHYPAASIVGDPGAAFADAVVSAAGPRGVVVLVHATAYSDDQQMMTYVSRLLRAQGIDAHLASPAHVRWIDGRASLDAAWRRGNIDAIVRFFPAEWLPQLAADAAWPSYFAGGRTPLANPATAILVQSKRFPLIWDELRTPLPTWRALLPETQDPRDVGWRGDPSWVLKPALGRVGEGIGMAESIAPGEWKRIRRAATWSPSHWVAQRRFTVAPLETDAGPVFPCLGVYTIDGRVAGAYGRLSARPLIDSRAEDAAVLHAA